MVGVLLVECDRCGGAMLLAAPAWSGVAGAVVADGVPPAFRGQPVVADRCSVVVDDPGFPQAAGRPAGSGRGADEFSGALQRLHGGRVATPQRGGGAGGHPLLDEGVVGPRGRDAPLLLGAIRL